MIQDVFSENKHRAYPFVEDSNLGSLPLWALLDITLINMDAPKNVVGILTCDKFSVAAGNMTLSFVYSCGDRLVKFSIPVALGAGISVGTAELSPTTVVKFAVYGGGSEYSVGVPDGTYDVGARILVTKILEISRDRKVSSFCGVSGTIHIVDGHNTTAKIHENKITIEAGSGLGLGDDCAENEDAFDCTKALLFINGQHADTSGNINIVGGDGVTVQTGRMAAVGGYMVPAITIRASENLKEVL